jgi:C-terminal processing protease CtpA/Prc
MQNSMFILSFAIHLGFFFLISKLTPSASPEPEAIEVTVEKPKGEAQKAGEEAMKVIPKGDTDALGKQCPYTYGGIGIDQGGGFQAIITKVHEGYAADRAGLKKDDIMYYTGEIRGDPGTPVYIKVFRKGNYINFTIIREKICYDI